MSRFHWGDLDHDLQSALPVYVPVHYAGRIRITDAAGVEHRYVVSIDTETGFVRKQALDEAGLHIVDGDAVRWEDVVVPLPIRITFGEGEVQP